MHLVQDFSFLDSAIDHNNRAAGSSEGLSELNKALKQRCCVVHRVHLL